MPPCLICTTGRDSSTALVDVWLSTVVRGLARSHATKTNRRHDNLSVKTGIIKHYRISIANAVDQMKTWGQEGPERDCHKGSRARGQPNQMQPPTMQNLAIRIDARQGAQGALHGRSCGSPRSQGKLVSGKMRLEYHASWSSFIIIIVINLMPAPVAQVTNSDLECVSDRRWCLP
jgi:hypothetical protein